MAVFEFHPSTSKFDLLNALRLAELSKLVGGPLDVAGTCCQQDLCFSQYRPFDAGDTEAFLAANDAVVILSFRGSQTRTDWLTDAQIKLVPLNGKRVHYGFNKALDYVWPDLYDAVCATRGPEQTLWVTGHSLGGALATLATDRLTDANVFVDGLYTFGQPRVGDGDFARQFDRKMKSRSFRFINDEDIVTRVPTPPWYSHIGTPCFFDNEGLLHLDHLFWAMWRSVSDSAAYRTAGGKAQTAIQNPDGPGDHNLDLYIRNIRKNLNLPINAGDLATA